MRFKTLPRKAYPSDLDLTDHQWMILEALVSPPRSGNLGRPQEVDLREGVNPIFYLNRSGYQWGMLPHDLPPRAPFTVTSPRGATTAPGKTSSTRCAGKSVRRPDASRHRALSASTASRSKRRRSVASSDPTTAARNQGKKAAFAGGYDGSVDRGFDHRRGVDDGTAAPQLLTQVSPTDFPHLTTIFGDNK